MPPSMSAPSVVGSASIWVLGRVAGPAREARVLHAHSNSIYLEFEGGALGILGARSLQLPFGVRTLMPELPRVGVGEVGEVHDGVVAVGDLRVLVTNIVDTTVPVLSPEAVTWGHEHLLGLVGDRVAEISGRLPERAMQLLGDADPQAVPELLGLGEGLTPLGDDVLAGFLATAVAIRHQGLPDVRSEVALSAFDKTTLIAASLLACAARGEAVPEFRSFMRGIATQHSDVVEQSLDLMLEVGGHSGAGYVIGAMQAFASAQK